MRPVDRGVSPQASDFATYTTAFPHLRGRLGPYCSYCERRIPTNLAVEHIQAKRYRDTTGAYPYLALRGQWTNFLLGCVNCNSTKGNKNVTLDNVFLPDRDNTFAAFTYVEDGTIEPAKGLSTAQRQLAKDTLALTGLNKQTRVFRDGNDKLVALDRVQDRAAVRLEAMDSLEDWVSNPSPELHRSIIKCALFAGFFSVWMDVFSAHPDLRRALINAFDGTARECFDTSTAPVSPRPLGHGLPHGSKV